MLVNLSSGVILVISDLAGHEGQSQYSITNASSWDRCLNSKAVDVATSGIIPHHDVRATPGSVALFSHLSNFHLHGGALSSERSSRLRSASRLRFGKRNSSQYFPHQHALCATAGRHHCLGFSRIQAAHKAI